ncbi:unnamed protein product [Didymodactylos carnosus]|uniref:Uncharacterized protein n=1 Tax=Didymodactylos carnosus TaxID=1234261 RepID=A0A814WIC5_9BILA|nr:unnamed protein product [Didymodactylos carnosus]CAF3967164.1 unnamed protein product [Didymodactylos carnosus]
MRVPSPYPTSSPAPSPSKSIIVMSAGENTPIKPRRKRRSNRWSRRPSPRSPLKVQKFNLSYSADDVQHFLRHRPTDIIDPISSPLISYSFLNYVIRLQL